MVWKKLSFIFSLYLVTGIAFGGNDALASKGPISKGERVSAYLQTMLTIKCQILDINRPDKTTVGFDYQEPIRLVVTYEPGPKTIEVSMVGTMEDPKNVQGLIGYIEKTILGYNKRLQEDFDVILDEKDISIGYLNVKNGKIVTQFKNGEFVNK
jgi:hypothetical protein